MKKAIISVWPFVPCLAISVLLHSTDHQVGGLSGVFSSPFIMLSVIIWAIPVAFGAYLSFVLYLKGGVAGYLAAAIPVAGVFGFIIASLGSTATTQAGFLWSAAGSCFALFVVLSFATVPSARAALKVFK